jgi:peptidylprolyl isomerase
MGTEKRERQKAGRAARIEAAQAAEAKARNRRRITTFAALLAGFAIVIGVAAWLGGGEDDAETETAADSTTSTFTLAPDAGMESAAGQPCVALAEPLPEGAPEVPVPVGPPPTELVVEDLTVGDGAEVTEGATVTVDYIGVSCSTGAIFDDSYKRGQPATFGLGQVIPGWTEGLVGMKVGGSRLLVIPPDMGYADTGSPPKIAPGETLVFVVDAVDTTPVGG